MTDPAPDDRTIIPATAPGELPSEHGAAPAGTLPGAAWRSPSPEEARSLLVSHGVTTPESLLRALNGPDEALGAAAATALGELGQRAAVERLIDLVRRPSIRRRPSPAAEAACIALGKLGGSRAVGELIELTQTPVRAGPALEGLEIALTRHASGIDAPVLSRLVAIPGIVHEVRNGDQVQRVPLDRSRVRELAQAELRRRASARLTGTE